MTENEEDDEDQTLFRGILCQECFEDVQDTDTNYHPYIAVKTCSALDMLEQKYGSQRQA